VFGCTGSGIFKRSAIFNADYVQIIESCLIRILGSSVDGNIAERLKIPLPVLMVDIISSTNKYEYIKLERYQNRDARRRRARGRVRRVSFVLEVLMLSSRSFLWERCGLNFHPQFSW
jgi:DNA-binding helix-hairpin-helix protein with protein kinase domain